MKPQGLVRICLDIYQDISGGKRNFIVGNCHKSKLKNSLRGGATPQPEHIVGRGFHCYVTLELTRVCDISFSVKVGRRNSEGRFHKDNGLKIAVALFWKGSVLYEPATHTAKMK